MNGYNAKNYVEQGGDIWRIGGTLIIEDDARVEGMPAAFTAAENQEASEAGTIADLRSDFNALLEKLKAAGLMSADQEEGL